MKVFYYYELNKLFINQQFFQLNVNVQIKNFFHLVSFNLTYLLHKFGIKNKLLMKIYWILNFRWNDSCIIEMKWFLNFSWIKSSLIVIFIKHWQACSGLGRYRVRYHEGLSKYVKKKKSWFFLLSKLTILTSLWQFKFLRICDKKFLLCLHHYQKKNRTLKGEDI